MAATRKITILGSTGSVGQNTLAVIEAHPAYSVYALTAHRNIDLLLTQCREFSPRFAVVTDPESADLFSALLQESDCDTELLRTEDALAQVASA